MAYEVVWSKEASEDLEAIGDYLHRSSPNYASTFVEKILDAASKLNKFPYAGRLVAEIGEEKIREKIVSNYRLIYQIEDESVIVLAIIHSRRLLPKDIF